MLVKRVGKAFQLVVTTCKQADKGKAPEETLIATLKPTAEDKIDYKPGIHEDIFLRLKVTLPDADKLKNNSQGFDGKPRPTAATLTSTGSGSRSDVIRLHFHLVMEGW